MLLIVFVRIPHSTSDVEAGEGGTGHSPSDVEAGEGGTGCMASPCIEWLFSGVRVKKVGTCASPFQGEDDVFLALKRRSACTHLFYPDAAK